MTGVSGSARDGEALMTSAAQDRGVVLARHRAVAPRPADADAVAAKPFSATWIG